MRSLLLFCFFVFLHPDFCLSINITLSLDGEREGPSEDLNPFQVMDDAIGSDLELSTHIPVVKNTIVQSGGSAKLTRAFQALAEGRCSPDRRNACLIAPDGLSTIGLVNYTFEHEAPNLKGGSFQSLLSCRCLTKACNYSIAAVPVVVKDESEDREFRTCLYPRKRGKDQSIVRCITVLLNITKIRRDQMGSLDFPLLNAPKKFNFSLENNEVSWMANGSRGVGYAISSDEYLSLDMIDVRDINTHEPASRSDLFDPDDDIFDFVRSATLEDDPCNDTIRYAHAGGAWRGGQQDSSSIGLEDSDFSGSFPEILRDTDIAFVVAASLVALVTAARLLYDHHDEEVNYLKSIYVLLIALSIYALEALALFISFSMTRNSVKWDGVFTHLDATLAVHRPLACNSCFTL